MAATARTLDRAPALTVADAAEQLRVSKCEVYALIRSGSLAAFKVGRVLRVEPSAIDDFKRVHRVHVETIKVPVVTAGPHSRHLTTLPFKTKGRYS